MPAVMSKAFTRESDEEQDEPSLPRASALLPAGTKNYLTVDGAERMRRELEHLAQVERARLASLPENAETKQQMRVLNGQIRQLEEILQSAEVVPVPPPPWEQVRFGASVTVREAKRTETKYRIVGVDETDMDSNHVSWRSPIAKALLNARVGQRVRFRAPDGEVELEIVGINYQ
jgi:transcription elongation factor GreB